MKKSGFLMSLLLCGCAGITPPDAFTYKEIQTDTFKIATWQKITNPKSDIRVYIEGDGHAFNNHGYPTNNPTPQSSFMRKIAFNDPNDNVVYLARPCQFITDSMCEEKYWTTARFSSEVITAEGQSITQTAGHKPVTLIGYSGGAQIAGLVATHQSNAPIHIKKIITIAGVLDHKAWTTYHDDLPLKKSSNLADSYKAFSSFPQIHYVGGKDDVVPLSLTKELVKDPNLIVVVPNATHDKGWKSILPDLYK